MCKLEYGNIFGHSPPAKNDPPRSRRADDPPKPQGYDYSSINSVFELQEWWNKKRREVDVDNAKLFGFFLGVFISSLIHLVLKAIKDD